MLWSRALESGLELLGEPSALDADGDGRADLLLACGGSERRLEAVSGAAGELLWQHALGLARGSSSRS